MSVFIVRDRCITFSEVQKSLCHFCLVQRLFVTVHAQRSLYYCSLSRNRCSVSLAWSRDCSITFHGQRSLYHVSEAQTSPCHFFLVQRLLNHCSCSEIAVSPFMGQKIAVSLLLLPEVAVPRFTLRDRCVPFMALETHWILLLSPEIAVSLFMVRDCRITFPGSGNRCIIFALCRQCITSDAQRLLCRLSLVQR